MEIILGLWKYVTLMPDRAFHIAQKLAPAWWILFPVYVTAQKSGWALSGFNHASTFGLLFLDVGTPFVGLLSHIHCSVWCLCGTRGDSAFCDVGRGVYEAYVSCLPLQVCLERTNMLSLDYQAYLCTEQATTWHLNITGDSYYLLFFFHWQPDFKRVPI